MSKLERIYDSAEDLIVQPFDMDALEHAFNGQHIRTDKWRYDFGRPLALIMVNGRCMVTDTECIFYPECDGVFKIPVWGSIEDAAVSVLPLGTAIYTQSELIGLLGPSKMSLTEFMGDRYKYNFRIEGNTAELLRHINNPITKKLTPRTKR